jgi:peptide/nickel transport system ATP-binding protein
LHAVPTAAPARRRERGRLRGQELPSPIRPRDYTPPQRCWRTVAEGHFVQDIA